MSKVGVKPICLPKGMEVDYNSDLSVLSLSFGSSSERCDLPVGIDVDISDSGLALSIAKKTKDLKRLLGLTRSIVFSKMQKVQKIYHEVTLNVNGVGYKASFDEGILSLSLGYSHDIAYYIPSVIDVLCKSNSIFLKSLDKQLLSMVAESICNIRSYDPYKGKGVIFVGKAKYNRRKSSSKK
ncbi:MAG: 50S ribosomal protein L6 [Candidatus Xenolissoclinum pacificiensis L6]|uniref:50S ribosomal protein L6 n=1 Tax=Candidatus Xenolissoclinum pacificiensis L6 TaxID=1401685 RepID=W2UZN6_9RICK|nr:MAG: 50S ribosomal protein L6 [Candidatus Xenolissoclinum pacificiensis L6]